MKPFEYTAQCEGGAAINGTIEAVDSDEALQQLTAMQLRNIELGEAKRETHRRSLRGDDFIFFNEQLAALAGSGICLDVGLRQLGKDLHSPRLRRVLEEISTEIEKGVSLDEAVSHRADQLPALYGRVVKAGVATGKLSATLLNLSHHLRLMAETRRLVWEALAYPAVVLVLACGLVCAVLTLIIPHIEMLFTDLISIDYYTRLPTFSATVLDLARILPRIIAWTGVALLVVGAGWMTARFSSSGRLLREKLLLGIPLLGHAIRGSIRSRFLRAMGFSIESGVTLPESIRLAADAAASPNLRRDAETLAQRVEKGEKAYAACRELAIVPPMFGYVVEVNADRNNLGRGLIELSKSYEMRARHSQSLLRAWVGPFAVIFVGTVIGFCVLAIFMPLVSVMQNIG